MSKGEAIMSAPPVSVVGITLAGISLENWVYIATLFWLGLQIGWFVYKRVQDWRAPDE